MREGVSTSHGDQRQTENKVNWSPFWLGGATEEGADGQGQQERANVDQDCYGQIFCRPHTHNAEGAGAAVREAATAAAADIQRPVGVPIKGGENLREVTPKFKLYEGQAGWLEASPGMTSVQKHSLQEDS
jgi:hypothetical protein